MQLLLHIDDIKKGNALLSFLKSLGHVQVEEVNDDTDNIPNWHKTLVKERIQSASPSDFIPWTEAKKKLKLKKKK